MRTKQGCWRAAAIVVLGVGAGSARADEPIRDNSFLIEEAYNQEPGVVQHIHTIEADDEGNWLYGFTQEWPLGAQAHQLSFTLPLAHDGDQTGFGDLAVNYRWQVLGVTGGAVALAPRVSLILPTGGQAPGALGALGGQLNLPLSVELGSRFALHSNLGATLLEGDDSAGMDGSLRWNVFAGQSAIWLATANVNLLTELTWTHADDGLAASDELMVSPGVRFAVNLPGGAQLVPGIAMPVRMNPDADTTETSVFVYLSFEHAMSTAP